MPPVRMELVAVFNLRSEPATGLIGGRSVAAAQRRYSLMARHRFSLRDGVHVRRRVVWGDSPVVEHAAQLATQSPIRRVNRGCAVLL